jgi:S-adenosylmethionine hydrolase
VKAVLASSAPRVPVLDATHAAPDFGIEPAAHLLAALAPRYPRGCVFVAVVDPGVGGKRDAIAMQADGRKYVGPDNGLLSVLWQRARSRKCWRIAWRPKQLGSSFHGRDLFAPVAAALASRRRPRGWLVTKRVPDVLLDSADYARILCIDHYGNCISGIRASNVERSWKLRVGKRMFPYAPSFGEARGPFWYENSLGLVELAMPRGSAARKLGLRAGQAITTAR